MIIVAVSFIAFCLMVGFMPDEITKLLLAMSWVALALMAVGATLYSLLSLLF